MTDASDRPYLKDSIVEIESLAQSQWSDPGALVVVARELFHRTTKRACVLRARVVERLVELIKSGFPWPSTEASPTDGSNPAFIDAPTTGMLSHLGYKVGASGLERQERRELLDTVYADRLPPVNSQDYMSEWGEPHSARRLQKMAESIAAFVRNGKRMAHPPKQAIHDWESDLSYLYTEYYVGTYWFPWPLTDLL